MKFKNYHKKNIYIYNYDILNKILFKYNLYNFYFYTYIFIINYLSFFYFY